MAKQGGGLESQLISGARFAAGPVVPTGSIASAGFEKGQKRVQAIQQAEFEKQKLEAQNYAKQKENTNKILDAIYKNKEDIKVNGELLPGEWKNMSLIGAMQIKLNEANLINAIRKGDLDKFSSLNMHDKTVVEPLRELKQLGDDFAELADEVDNVQANISSRVSAEKIAMVNGIMQGDKKIIYQVAKQYGIPVREVANKSILKKIGYVAADYSAAENLFNTTQQAAQKAVKEELSAEAYIDKVKKDLSILMNGMSDEQIVSTAFDFLGKQTPDRTKDFSEYIVGVAGNKINDAEKIILQNFNKNNPDSMDAIRNFVYENFIEAAQASYDDFKGEYKDKIDPQKDDLKETKNSADSYVEELNNALSNYDFSMLHNTKIGGKLITGSEIRDGKLYLEYTARTTSEGQQIGELAGIDLNDKVRIKALLSEYIKGQKGLSVSNKVSNVITDDMLLTIEDINKKNSILFPSPTTKPNLP